MKNEKKNKDTFHYFSYFSLFSSTRNKNTVKNTKRKLEEFENMFFHYKKIFSNERLTTH